jgi:putative copper resistance protein D
MNGFAAGAHLLAVALLAGEQLFAAAVLPRHDAPRLARDLTRLAKAGLVAAAVSAVIWLWSVAAEMSGLGMSEAVLAIPRVLADTGFGHIWIARMSIVPILAVSLFAKPSRQFMRIGTVLALALLLSLVATGHAAGSGIAMAIQAVHLLAAGLWFGGLAALLISLRQTSKMKNGAPWAAALTRRFGLAAGLAVSLLAASGACAAAFHIRSISALAATPYGHFVWAKTALFLAALGIAAVNRWRVLPRLEKADNLAHLPLLRGIAVELAIVGAILLLAGWLGVTPPPHHRI